MKIINYDSELEVKSMAEKLKSKHRIITSILSTSFRIYDDNGNTTELHIYKKPPRT